MDVRRIAVVDNDRVYLGVIRDLLEDEGFAVLTHDDLASGCTFLRQHRPELAIVDILQQREPLRDRPSEVVGRHVLVGQQPGAA